MQFLKLWPWTKSNVPQDKIRPFNVYSGWSEVRNVPTEHQEADKAELRLFRKVKEELTMNVKSETVLTSSRIVIPTEKGISLAHEGQQGIVKTLRENVWFPGILESISWQRESYIQYVKQIARTTALPLYRCHNSLRLHGIHYTLNFVVCSQQVNTYF